MLRGSRSYSGPASVDDTASAGWLRIKRAGHRGVDVGGASHNTAHARVPQSKGEEEIMCISTVPRHDFLKTLKHRHSVRNATTLQTQPYLI